MADGSEANRVTGMEADPLTAALLLADRGRRVFPCRADKTPRVRWKEQATTDPSQIHTWWETWPDAMIGLPTGDGLAVVDLDVDKETGEPRGQRTAESLGLWEMIQQGLIAHTPSGGLHAYFSGELPTTTGRIGPGIDTRGTGGYVIAPDSHNATGSYRWATLGLTEVAPPSLPPELSHSPERCEVSPARIAAPTVVTFRSPTEPASEDEVLDILSFIDPDAGGYDRWCQVLMGLHDHFGGGDQGLRIAEAWSARGAKFSPGEVPRKWASFKTGGGATFASVCALARQNGADLSEISRRHRNFSQSSGNTGTQETQSRGLPGQSDEALALSFADHHADNLRYVAPWGQWLIWKGQRWEPDKSLATLDLARRICRDAAARCERPGRAEGIASAKTVAAVERLAKSDRRLAATTEQWDADIWLLNTPSGVFDLRTGAARPQRPNDYLTRSTTVAPGGACPTWERFLEDITDGDGDLIAYMKRLAGYALTGSTREQNLAFLHGTGGNGKSVFLSVLSGILGDYHKVAPIETFTASSGGDRHPTELAMLRGARLVTAVETEEGRRWAESRIKALTGGDPISARYMRQDFFEFTPQFKLVIAGNHKPGLRSVDEAIRRRLHLVPFTVTIPEDRRDPELGSKLKAEWPGILAWAIEGCLDWQREGLAPPRSVLAATEQYMEGQDALGAWLSECCDTDPDGWEATSALYASWKGWADRNGEFVLPRARFADALETRGIRAHRRNTGRGYAGLRLRQIDYSDAHWNR